MRFWLLLFLSFPLTHLIAQTDADWLESEMYDLPGLAFKRISGPADNYLKYE